MHNISHGFDGDAPIQTLKTNPNDPLMGTLAGMQTILCEDNKTVSEKAQRIISKVNGMFNSASELIDRNPSKYCQYLIEQGCKDLIIGLDDAIFLTIQKQWIGDFESTMIKFENTTWLNVDKSLLHETLGLYYESLKQYDQASTQFIMSIDSNHENNETNDLIMVSH